MKKSWLRSKGWNKSVPARIIIRMLLVALMSAPATTAWAEDETIIYLHGYIIEIEGTQPVHERFGLYDFNGFVEALGSDGAFYLSRPEWLEPVLDWVAERG